jgi:hypothetical protein
VPRLRDRSALLLYLVSPTLGCPSDELPAVQWEGEHVIFAAEHPDQVCAGTREYLDRRVGEMLDRLGSDPLEIEYYLLDDVAEYCTLGSEVSGCGEAGLVYSEMVPHLHEIVHARSGDLMPQVLEEGLATHFGDPYPFTGMAPRERMIELLTSDINGLTTLSDYGRAAHFVTFISERFGWESLLELDAELSAESTSDEVDAAFRAILGLGIDGLLDAYEEFPECTGIVDTSIACTSPAVPPDFLSTTYARLVDCASAEGIGPHEGMAFMEEVIELAPPIDGSRIVVGVGEGMAKGGFVLLRRCGPCSENGVGTVTEGLAFVSEADLPAGRYVARYYLPLEAGPAVVGVRISD